MVARDAKAAKKEPHWWLDKADRRYVTARFLYWKGFREDFALTGSLAFELYLKAFLVLKTGGYRRTHDLELLCTPCGHHCSFFNSLLSDPNWEMTWPTYRGFFRYPESLPGEDRPHYSVTSSGPDGTVKVLDSVAHFVRSRVPRPNDSLDLIALLISEKRWGYWHITPINIFAEIRQLFLHANEYFSG